MRWLSLLLVAACKPAPFERVPGSAPISASFPVLEPVLPEAAKP
jgi:hypothetical protein